jgi:Uma2 family endonuclease
MLVSTIEITPENTAIRRYSVAEFFAMVDQMEAAGFNYLLEYYNGYVVPKNSSVPISELDLSLLLSNDIHNFINKIHPMATVIHDRIISNLNKYVGFGVENTNFFVYGNTTFVYIAHKNSYVIPDITVTDVTKEQRTAENWLVNPLIVIEVLSKSTRAKDQNDKFQSYRKVEGLQEYIMIEQEQVYIQQFIRQESGKWTLCEYENLTDILLFEAIPLGLGLQKIYDKVGL